MRTWNCRVWVALLASISFVTSASDAQIVARTVPKSDVFYSILGSDTIAVERVTRDSTHMRGELVLVRESIRWTYDLVVTPSSLVSRMDDAYFSHVSDSLPTQRATLQFVGDSVFVQIHAATPTLERIQTQAGAVPYVNLSSAMLQLLLDRARVLGPDSVTVPMFLVSGGMTVPAAVRRTAPDSLIVSIANAVFRVAVTRDGDLLGAQVPSQHLRIIRGSELVRMPSETPQAANHHRRVSSISIERPGRVTLVGTLVLPDQDRTCFGGEQ